MCLDRALVFDGKEAAGAREVQSHETSGFKA